MCLLEDIFLKQICDIEGYSRTNLVHVCYLLRQFDRYFPVMLGLILRVTTPNLQATPVVKDIDRCVHVGDCTPVAEVIKLRTSSFSRWEYSLY